MMRWKQLLCETRAGRYPSRSFKNTEDPRSEFEKDYHRIIGSASFRRLQDKTQVFALDKSDFIRTRLTHSLEVSSFAKSLGQSVSRAILSQGMDPAFTHEMQSDVCDILQCAGLIHDIGNPPFGHFGEEVIRDWFLRKLPSLSYKDSSLENLLGEQQKKDLIFFEGNAQALRQVCKLHFLVNEHGMNLTYGLLGTIIKYPVSSLEMEPDAGKVSRKKLGFFWSEEGLVREIARETGTGTSRHPLAFLLEAADDIAYKTADIEDSFKKGFFTYRDLKKALEEASKKAKNKEEAEEVLALLTHQVENGRRRGAPDPFLYGVQNFVVRLQSRLLACATQSFLNHYSEIMEGTWEKDLFYETSEAWVMDALGEIAWHYAFDSEQILQMELTAGGILEDLLDRFIPAAMYYDTDRSLTMMERRLLKLISSNYRQIYHVYSEGVENEGDRLYLRLLLVTDFISGMTDSYARDLYQRLNGMV